MKHLSRSSCASLASLGLLAFTAGCTSTLPAAVQSPDSQGYGYGGGAAVARQAWGTQPAGPQGAQQNGWGQPTAQNNGWGQPNSAGDPNAGWGAQGGDPMQAWGNGNPNGAARQTGWPAGQQPNPALQPLRPDGSTQWTPGLQSGQSTDARQQAWNNSVPDNAYGRGQDAYSGYAEGAESLNSELASPWDQQNGYGAGSANPAMNAYQPGSVGQVDPNRRSMNGAPNTGAQLFDELQQVRGERDQLMGEVQFLSQALLEAQNQLLSSEQSANRGGHELQMLQAQVTQLEQKLAKARADNEELAARLYQAQIGRLKAERTLLEDRIGESARDGGIPLQPGASKPNPQGQRQADPTQPGAGFGGQAAGGGSTPTAYDRTQTFPPTGGLPTRAQSSPFARPGAGFEGQGNGNEQGAGNSGAPSQIPPPTGVQGGGF